MTREEKKQELIALFATGAMPIGELIDACFAFADNHHHWISVEDELPKDYESVLAAVGGNHFAFVGICLNKKTWYCNIQNKSVEIEGITHWMPLPQPPQKGGKE